ncbi:MAG: hypothetical protein WD065_19445 [Planctomycetaceae bacterium]
MNRSPIDADALIHMVADPEIQSELRQIDVEFAWCEPDGLEQKLSVAGESESGER